MSARRAALVPLLLAALPVFGHHALPAEYDTNQQITLKGTVTKIAWTNPHVRLSLKTKDALVDWDLELSSPNVLFSERLENRHDQAGRPGKCLRISRAERLEPRICDQGQENRTLS
jgi:hypothetical protein